MNSLRAASLSQRKLLPGSALTQRRSAEALSGAGTQEGSRPGSSGRPRPTAQLHRPQTPPLLPAGTSCLQDTSGGRFHSGSGCSEQLWGGKKDTTSALMFNVKHLISDELNWYYITERWILDTLWLLCRTLIYRLIILGNIYEISLSMWIYFKSFSFCIAMLNVVNIIIFYSNIPFYSHFLSRRLSRHILPYHHRPLDGSRKPQWGASSQPDSINYLKSHYRTESKKNKQIIHILSCDSYCFNQIVSMTLLLDTVVGHKSDHLRSFRT